jgi:outer membrane protein OmpA-like peptidoglycan-associated protein
MHDREINKMKKQVWLFLFLLGTQLSAQIRSGAVFLKMPPGSRQQSMGNSATALLDDQHAVFANPGSGGFLREWYWSASYTKWIAGVYNASLLAGKNFGTPWSSRTLFNLGLLYQGVGDFDSAELIKVGASDLVLALNIGQPLTFLTSNLSLGANVKYLASKLASYDANTLVFDSGLLYRTPRFKLGNQASSLFPYGLVSIGVSMVNMGSALTFISQETPLPREFRAGLAFYAGRHNGLQVQVSADYHSRKDEGSHMGFGAELSWDERFAIHGGYDASNDLLEKYSFGFSIRLDDQNSPVGVLPGRNNALRLDFASMNEREFFHHTYRGTVSHIPIGPERCKFLTPPVDTKVYSDSVMLSCTLSREPDLFDDVRYLFFMDQDSVKLAQKIDLLTLSPTQYLQNPDTDVLMTVKDLTEPRTPATRLSGGDYYWAAAAYDTDHHIRMAAIGKRTIAHFKVPFPDLIAEDVEFEYHPWITQDEYQGKLRARISNMGEHWAKHVIYTIYDSLITPAPGQSANHAAAVIKTDRLPVMLPGESRFINIDWNTPALGKHAIIVKIDSELPLKESNKNNNVFSKAFYTVPKGVFAAKDTLQIITAITRSFALPIITEVCFDTLSTRVKEEYLLKKVVEPPLDILSDRLVKHRNIQIRLQGFIDPNSGETDLHLADLRAQAVRDSMISKGVAADQITLLPGETQARRYVPANPQDARWVFEERRYVKITTDTTNVPILFEPLNYVDVENLASPALFTSDLHHTLKFKKGLLYLQVEGAQDSVLLESAGQTQLQGSVVWDMPVHDYFKKSPWINQPTQYIVQLTDSLQRTFSTYPRTFLPIGKAELREHTVAFPLKFNKTDPLYSFYWANILESIEEILTDPAKRFRFYGHACAIGNDRYNLNLSDTRANSFHDSFLHYIKESYPEVYQRIVNRTDSAKGYGEEKPLGVIRSTGETVLIGENNLPTGRKLNRRIEINFYTKDK